MRPRSLPLLSALLLLLPLVVLLPLVPGRLAAREAERWRQPEAALRLSDWLHAQALAPPAGLGPTPLGIDPGGEQFVGEWIFGTWMMAAAGHAQLGLALPERGPELADRAALAIDRAIAPESWAFDRLRWGDSAFSHLDGQGDHDHAVLGYLGVALGLLRLLQPTNRHAALHDRVVAHLERRLAGNPALETFPAEAYPVDHAAALATLALHARATGGPPSPLLAPALADFAARYLDERGLLIQAVEPGTGRPRSVARGSGSALGAWFIGHVDDKLATRLGEAIRAELATTRAGLGVVREYAPATCATGHPCRGDVDSGPLILGASVSATGFAMASARRLGDRAWLGQLAATAALFGLHDGRHYRSGGPLGNAILLAMLSTPER